MEKTTIYCRLCKTDLPLNIFTSYQQTAPYPRCKPCVSKKSSDWYHGNREHRLGVQQEWLAANREKARLKCKAWRKANPGKAGKATRKSAAALKERVFDHYGRVCACCNESTFRFLCIDHINNDGWKHRKELKVTSGTQFYSWLERNGFPVGFQTLCYNCNQGKHQNGGVCPHKETQCTPINTPQMKYTNSNTQWATAY